MNYVGDSNFTSDNESKAKDDIPEMKNKREDLDVIQLKHRGKQYERNLLKNAHKKVSFLEHQSLVDFIEADREYIVSAGRDHDINVWDAMEFIHIRRFSGHCGPVTGLHLYCSGQKPVDKNIISSSEDGTIRQWSIGKGEELRKFETDSLITCMGVMHQVLAITGNHKGYMEVRHLSTGELYSTILAHLDPVDAIVVEDNYACSATFDMPSCVKVWEIQFEQTVCIYSIEEWSKLEFGSLALWNSTIFMGATNQQKLHVVNFKTDEKGLIDLERTAGCVQQVRVVDGWILTCSVSNKKCILDVHRAENFDHFGTFDLNFHQVFAIAAIESDSSLKIILGGSALAVLKFDFILMQDETNLSSKSFFRTNTYNLKENKKKGHYTLRHAVKNKYSEDENSSDSDEYNAGDEESNMQKNALTGDDDYNPYKSVLCHLHPSSEAIQSKVSQNVEENIKKSEEEEIRKRLFLRYQHPVSQPNTFPSSTSSNTKEKTSVKIDEMKTLLHHCNEPRVAMKKLEEMLDKEEKSIGLGAYMKNNKNYEAVQERNDIFKKLYTDNKYKEKFMVKSDEQNHLETIKEESKIKELDLADGEKRSQLLSTSDKNCINAENRGSSSMGMVEEIDNGSTKPTKKKSKVKKQKNKSDKKQNQQNKRNKCIIM